MKKFLLPLSTVLAALWIVFSSNASGAGQNQGVDRTGSPISNSFCGDCHDGGSFRPSVQIALLRDTTPVTSYEPGKTYNLRVRITAGTGTPGAYGYQATVLTSTRAQAGAFGTAPTGQRVLNIGGRQYAEQSRRSTANAFIIPWTAPLKGTGTVTVYATGLAVNSNNNSGGDNAQAVSLALTESTATSTNAVEALAVKVQAYPNPATDFVRLDISGELPNRQLWVDLLDGQGRILQRQNLFYAGQNAQTQLGVQALPRGQYWVRISDGKRVKTLPIQK
jgi:hypothetical protein